MTEQDMIRLIAEEVLRRVEDMGGLASVTNSQAKNGVLVLIPSYIADEAALMSYLKRTYQEPVTCILWENAVLKNSPFKTARFQAGVDETQLMASLNQYGEIVLAIPPITLLKNIASGDDSGFIEQLVMRAILWEKKVSCVLDYTMPKFKRSTVFEVLCDALDALKDMGVKVVSTAPGTQKAMHGLSLVTETDVEDTYKKAGTSVITLPGAIITPLARDKAKELNIAIVNEQGVNEV